MKFFNRRGKQAQSFKSEAESSLQENPNNWPKNIKFSPLIDSLDRSISKFFPELPARLLSESALLVPFGSSTSLSEPVTGLVDAWYIEDGKWIATMGHLEFGTFIPDSKWGEPLVISFPNSLTDSAAVVVAGRLADYCVAWLYPEEKATKELVFRNDDWVSYLKLRANLQTVVLGLSGMAFASGELTAEADTFAKEMLEGILKRLPPWELSELRIASE